MTIPIYLWVNAALYGVFSLWCAFAWKTTSRNLGFSSLTSSGQSEYLTIYGGLQLGMALFFAYAAWRPSFQIAGLHFAVFLYAGIVLFRMGSALFIRELSSTTWSIAALEVALLIWGAILLRGFLKTSNL